MSIQRKIFISYRQKDNPDLAAWIRAHFINRYQRENVFMDFDSIPTGVKFADFIRAEVQKCDAVIAVIGPRWLELLRENAANFAEDYVRIELGLALQLDKPVVPICINGASIPKSEDLPPELLPMLNYNAAFLDRKNLLDKIEYIVKDVEQILNEKDRIKAQKYYETGDIKWRARDYEGTIYDCTMAIQLDPEFAEAFNRRGTALKDKGDLKGAMDDYREALRLNPKFVGAYNNLGIVLRAGHEFDAAIDSYDIAIRLAPNYALSYYNRSHAREDKNDLKGAIADYQKYLDLGGGKQYDNQKVIAKRIHELKKRLKS